jgi:prevent-host-death family protein
MKVAAGVFKAKCLKFIDQVNQTHEVLIITKHGVPKAKLVPMSEEPKQLFGFMKGTGQITGDIVSPLNEKWEADQ